jgi:hypothetical protein
MTYWIGIIVSPLIFLTLLSVNYALVGWACAHQQAGVLHATAAVATIAIGLVLGFGWRDIRRRNLAAATDPVIARIGFLWLLNVALSSLSALAIVGMWFTQLAIPACVS